jgi:hypothetical protein
MISGIGFSLEYLYLPFAVFVFALLLKFSKNKITDSLIFLFGVSIPNLPILLFDLRHGFYHLNTLIRYSLDVVGGRASGKLFYYDFLPVLPILFIVAARLIVKIGEKSKALVVAVVLVYVFANLNSSRINFEKPTGMPQDLTVANITKTAGIISKDDPANFNVAVVNDFDTRGHILRYPLTFIFDQKPMGVTDYPTAEVLYVLAARDYNFDNAGVWEVSSFAGTKKEKITDIGSDFALFKLEK